MLAEPPNGNSVPRSSGLVTREPGALARVEKLRPKELALPRNDSLGLCHITSQISGRTTTFHFRHFISHGPLHLVVIRSRCAN